MGALVRMPLPSSDTWSRKARLTSTYVSTLPSPFSRTLDVEQYGSTRWLALVISISVLENSSVASRNGEHICVVGFRLECIDGDKGFWA